MSREILEELLDLQSGGKKKIKKQPKPKKSKKQTKPKKSKKSKSKK